MDENRKIERVLRRVPDIAVPEKLSERLKANVRLPEAKRNRAVLRQWFARGDGGISLRRVACAAALAVACMLPLGFGATRMFRWFLVHQGPYGHEKVNVERADKKTATQIATVTTYRDDSFVTGENIRSAEDAQQAEREMIELIKEGQAQDVGGGVFRAILPAWGEVIYETHGLPLSVLTAEDRPAKIEAMYGEMERLRQAGKFESTLDREEQKEDGTRVRYYQERFTLSSGESVLIYRAQASRD